ncbi:hypothetical protein Btru_054805 [Bulinus truncatus]|nr:hypothetical protein Btru_054805 [Bulinus truncatus]
MGASMQTSVLTRYVIALVLAELVATSTLTTKKPASVYTVAEFKPPSVVFNHLAFNEKTEDIYAGAVNYIYQLDKNLNLKEVSSAISKGMSELSECPVPIVMNSEDKMQKIINKVLLVDILNDWLIVCGTNQFGSCNRRPLYNISIVNNSPICEPVVGYHPDSSVVAFIAPGPVLNPGGTQSIRMYVGVSTPRLDALDHFSQVFVYSSRGLDDMKVLFSPGAEFHSSGYTYPDMKYKEIFTVKNILGFSFKNYSYKIGVQKDDNLPRNHSVIARICQTNKVFSDYSEMVFQCHYKDVNYTILQAAFIGKPGRDLATYLGIDMSSPLLYTVFSVDPMLPHPRSSAVCIFPLDYIRQRFRENIIECKLGRGQLGGRHLGNSAPCTNHSQLNIQIDDDFCRQEDPENYFGPLIADVPAILTMNNTPEFNSLAVSVTEEYTVGYIGASDGSIYKVSLDSNVTANLFEIVSVASNETILPDTFFDNNRNHVYVMTSTRFRQDSDHFDCCSRPVENGGNYFVKHYVDPDELIPEENFPECVVTTLPAVVIWFEII